MDAADRLDQARRVRSLEDAAERAYELASLIQEEILRLQQEESSATLTPLQYALGICRGDVDIATNRLAGLKNELAELARTLEERARLGI